MSEAQDNGARPASEMTKRERMAMAAMQGLCANPDFDAYPNEYASHAVKCADALLAELAKPKDGAK